MKTCFKCGKTLPLSGFYKHPGMADGHLGKCKECAKADSIATRYRKIEHYAAYDAFRNTTDNRKARRAVYLKNFRARNAAKVSAHNAVRRAVASGRLIRPKSCSECGAISDGTRRTQIHAHHDDYSRKLDVRWLCPACHVKQHTELQSVDHSVLVTDRAALLSD